MRPRTRSGGDMTLASRSNEMAPMVPTPRNVNWTRQLALALYEAPFSDLLFQAQTAHRQHFDPNKVQLSRLLSIKTGGCPGDGGHFIPSAPLEFPLNGPQR